MNKIPLALIFLIPGFLLILTWGGLFETKTGLSPFFDLVVHPRYILKNIPIIFKEKTILRYTDLIKFKREIKNNLNYKKDIVITSGAVSAGKFDFFISAGSG